MESELLETILGILIVVVLLVIIVRVFNWLLRSIQSGGTGIKLIASGILFLIALACISTGVLIPVAYALKIPLSAIWKER